MLAKDGLYPTDRFLLLHGYMRLAEFAKMVNSYGGEKPHRLANTNVFLLPAHPLIFTCCTRPRDESLFFVLFFGHVSVLLSLYFPMCILVLCLVVARPVNAAPIHHMSFVEDKSNMPSSMLLERIKSAIRSVLIRALVACWGYLQCYIQCKNDKTGTDISVLARISQQ